MAFRDMRLGQAAHRRENVGLFVETRVKGDEPFERGCVSGIHPENAIQHFHGDAALTARECLLDDRRQHFQGTIGIPDANVKIGQRLSDSDVVGIARERALKRGPGGA